jgi:hypothetical protein
MILIENTERYNNQRQALKTSTLPTQGYTQHTPLDSRVIFEKLCRLPLYRPG